MTDDRIGKRVEIAPHFDLWMRGARFGTVRRVKTGKDGRVLLVLKMDHPQVKRLQTVPVPDGVQRWL